MCINYRIHHEHCWHYRTAGCPLNPNFAANADELQAQQYGTTDYVLALSQQTSFVKARHERRHREPDECRTSLQKSQPTKQTFTGMRHGGLPQIYRRTRC